MKACWSFTVFGKEEEKKDEAARWQYGGRRRSCSVTGKCRRSVGFGDCWNLEGNDEGKRDCSEGEVVPVVVAIFRDPGSGSVFRFFGRKKQREEESGKY